VVGFLSEKNYAFFVSGSFSEEKGIMNYSQSQLNLMLKITHSQIEV
jgi:hypothetical protein